jgi:hypothetical protein
MNFASCLSIPWGGSKDDTPFQPSRFRSYEKIGSNVRKRTWIVYESRFLWSLICSSSGGALLSLTSYECFRSIYRINPSYRSCLEANKMLEMLFEPYIKLD